MSVPTCTCLPIVIEYSSSEILFSCSEKEGEVSTEEPGEQLEGTEEEQPSGGVRIVISDGQT